MPGDRRRRPASSRVSQWTGKELASLSEKRNPVAGVPRPPPGGPLTA